MDNNVLNFPNQSSVDDNPYDGFSNLQILIEKQKNLKADKEVMMHHLAMINKDLDEVGCLINNLG